MKTYLVSAPLPYGTICIPCENESDLFSSLTCRLPDPILSNTFLRWEGGESYSLRVRLVGGKGGFGSQLRATKSRKGKVDKNAMADVSGRKMRTLQRAQTLISALKGLPDQQLAQRREKREELMRIVQAESSGNKTREVFEDEDYLVTSERLVEDLKRAMQRAHQERDDEETFSEQEEDGDEQGTVSGSRTTLSREKESFTSSGPRKLPGWDDEDDLDSNASSDVDDDVPVQKTTTGKGKEKKIVSSIKDAHVRKRVKA